MKRLRFLVFIMLFIFTLSICFPAYAASKKYDIKVTLTSVKLVSNNHVGNAWSTYATANGKSFFNSPKTFKLSTSSKLKIVLKAIEKDKYPDKGSITVTIPVKNLKIGTKTYTKYVTVKENKGRYAGKKAKWKFVFKVTRTK